MAKPAPTRKDIAISYDWEIRGIEKFYKSEWSMDPDGYISPFWYRVYDFADWLLHVAMSHVKEARRG